LNERITFVVAALIGDLGASILVYLIAPSGPLCARFPSLLSYAGQHGSLAAITWLVVWTGTWLTMGPRAMRPRQNLSTKIGLLITLGVVGLVIDNAVSVSQQYISAPEPADSWWSWSVPPGLAERTLIYAIAFAGVVLLSYLFSRTQKPNETPPPPFGRE
jgi:hypothetical protein